MIVVALDTSGPVGSVALRRDGASDERTLDTQQRHSSLLLPTVEELLRTHGVAARDVNLWAVGLGPGSYTGIRVGIAAVKGLAMAWGRPAVGVGSLGALLHEHSRQRAVAAFTDARRGEFYFALAANGETRVPLRLVTLDALPSLVSEPAMFIGPEIKRYEPEIAKQLGPLALFPPADVHPRASVIAELAGQQRADAPLQPIYLRETSFLKLKP